MEFFGGNKRDLLAAQRDDSGQFGNDCAGQPFAYGGSRNIDLFDNSDIDIVHFVNELFPRYALVSIGQACAGDEGLKAGRVVGVEDVRFAGSRLLITCRRGWWGCLRCRTPRVREEGRS